MLTNSTVRFLRLWAARRRQLFLPPDCCTLQRGTGGDGVRILRPDDLHLQNAGAPEGHWCHPPSAWSRGFYSDCDQLEFGHLSFQREARRRVALRAVGVGACLAERVVACGKFPRHAGPQPAISPEYKRWLDEVPVRGEWQQTLNEMRANGSSELGLPIVANGESRDYIGAPVVDLVLGQQSFQESCKIAT